MDWKKLLADQQRRKHSKDPNRNWKTYSKAGWVKAEQIAEELDCNRNQVAGLLKDSIADKRIEREEFTIWNKDLDVLEKVLAFRRVKPGNKPVPAKKPRGKALKPAVGMTVRSRRGNKGRIVHAGRSVFTIEWENGSTTNPSLASFKKRDILLEG